ARRPVPRRPGRSRPHPGRRGRRAPPPPRRSGRRARPGAAPPPRGCARRDGCCRPPGSPCACRGRRTSAPPQGAARHRECSGPRSSLLLLILVHDLGVDHVVIVRRLLGARSVLGALGALGLRVDRGADGLQRLVQRVPLGLELLGGGVLVRQLLLGLLDGILGLGAVAVGDLLLVVLEQLLALVDELLEGVAGVGVLAALLVLGGVRLGVLHHAVDVLLGQG